MNSSEFRQDPVSGDWVIISPKRFNRPDQFKKKKSAGWRRKISPIKGCPFEDPQKSNKVEPILALPDKKNWKVQIIPNKFPAVSHEKVCSRPLKTNFYSSMSAVGYHDIVISRDHYKNFVYLSLRDVEMIFKAFKNRYEVLAKDSCSKYISIFHNWGPSAGASIFHPHAQIISLPIIPPDVSRSLWGSFRYFKKEKRCVHCDIIKNEKKHKKRIVFENKDAIAFTAYAAREPFELRIFPKKHLSYFEETPSKIITAVIEALQKVLLKIETKLGDPDYNFFIHTAPADGKKNHKHYHWHIELQPKFSISAGFEMSTGIEITTVDPDDAAKMLRA